MCGLYGYTTKQGVRLGKKQKETRNRILAGLAIAMQERGSHSTGVAGLTKDRVLDVTKKALSAEDFIRTKEFKDFLEINPRTVIGHTRYATVGEINDDNAHPFEEGYVVGAHNGSVFNWKDIYSEGKVDSQAIFHNLSEKNHFKDAFKELRGKFAITWLDARSPDSLFLVLSGNPLSIVRVPELQTYFWTSTYLALQSVIESHFDIKKSSIWTPKEDFVYEIQGNHSINKTKVEFKEFEYSTIYKANDDSVNKESQEFLALTCKAPAVSNPNETDFDEEDIEAYDFNNIIKNDKESSSRFAEIMNLSVESMEKIVDAYDACQFCQRIMDVSNEGMWWNHQSEIILCYKCVTQLDVWTECLWLSQDDFEDIDQELILLSNKQQQMNHSMRNDYIEEVD